MPRCDGEVARRGGVTSPGRERRGVGTTLALRRTAMLWSHRNQRAQTRNQQPCTHAGALPRWDRVEDTGRDDRVSRLFCPRCGQFIPARHG